MERRNSTNESNKEDFDLLKSYLGGDQSAFETLYYKYHKLLFNYCSGYARVDDMELQDLVHQVFIKLIELVQTGNGPKTNFKSYLLDIARSKMVNEYRKQSRNPGSLDDPSYHPDYSDSTPNYSLEELIQIADLIKTSLILLTPLENQVLNLFIFQGRRHKQIAKSLKITPGYSKVILNRAITRLKENTV